MNTVAKLTQKQIEKLAVEIRTFLLEHDMWVDTQIYFNGKCFDTHDNIYRLHIKSRTVSDGWQYCS